MKRFLWCFWLGVYGDYLLVDDAIGHSEIVIPGEEVAYNLDDPDPTIIPGANSLSSSPYVSGSVSFISSLSTASPRPPRKVGDDDLAWDLACLSHLPITLFREAQHNGSALADIRRLFFPTMESVHGCLSLNSHSLGRYLQKTKFCLGTFSIDPLELVGQHGPLKIGVSVGLCLPERCTSKSFYNLFNFLCAIPECIDLQDRRLVESCAKLQPLLCGPLDRFAFEHDFRLTCLNKQKLYSTEGDWKREVERFKEGLEIVQNLVDDISHPEEIFSLLQTLVPSHESPNIHEQHAHGEDRSGLRQLLDGRAPSNIDHDVDEETDSTPDFSPNQTPVRFLTPGTDDALIGIEALDVFLSCGTDTIAQAPSLYPKTGGFQQLGAWDQCAHNPTTEDPQPFYRKFRNAINHEKNRSTMEQGGRYCLMRYLSLLGSGHCVSAKCSSEKLMNLARMMCDMSVTGMGVWTSCLDLINVVPLDICVLIQLFGCNDYAKISAIFSKGVDSWTVISEALGITNLTTDIGAPKRFLSAADSLISQLPEPVSQFLDILQLEQLTVPLRKLSSSPTHLQMRPIINVRPPGELSCQAFCDYAPLPHKSATFVISAFIMVTCFALLPLAACMVKALSDPPAVESAESVARRSKAQKLLLYQYPRSPKPQEKSGSLRSRISPGHKHSSSPTQSSTSRDTSQLIPSGSKVESLIMCFHPGHNWKAYESTIKNVKNGEFPHLCGLRVASMMWIVIAHTFSFMATSGLVSNMKSGLHLIQKFDFQLIIGGMYAVDSFFFFTGFLVAVYGGPSLQIVVQSASHGARNHASTFVLNLKILFFSIFHRYLRLGGVYFTLLALWIWGVPHLSSGPMWPAMVNWIRHGYDGGCQDYWWTNLLFINNLIPHFGGGDCMGWTWYLANDFQFFVISTTLLLVRRASVKSFAFLCVMLMVGSWGIGLVTVVQHNLTSALFGACLNSGAKAKIFETVRANEMYYSKPWCRFPPHLVGVIWGVIYRTGTFERWIMETPPAKDDKSFSELSGVGFGGEVSRPMSSLSSPSEDRSPAPRLGQFPKNEKEPGSGPPSPAGTREVASIKHWAARVIPWVHVVSAFTMAAVVFIQYGPNNSPLSFWPRWMDVLYQVLGRSIWAVCLGWFCVSLTYAISEHRNRPRLMDRSLTPDSHFLSFPSPTIDDWLSKGLLHLWGAPIFISLASFCYCVYLIHPMLQSIYFASSLTSFYESQGIGYFNGVGFCILSFLVAVPFTICVEISLSKCARLIGL